MLGTLAARVALSRRVLVLAPGYSLIKKVEVAMFRGERSWQR
jgi:hypothetical protein